MRTARLLFFTGPQFQNAPQADWSREFEGLKEVLENQSCMELEPPTFSGKRSDFARLLSPKTAPDLLHFSGHGQKRNLLLLNEFNQQSTLEENEAKILFADCKNMGVVLNACSSARVAEAISGSVLFAVGYQGLLQDEIAIAFTKSFYRLLSENYTLSRAFEIAVTTIGGSGLHADTTPILFCNSRIDAKTYTLCPGAEKHSKASSTYDLAHDISSTSNSIPSEGSEQHAKQSGPENHAVSNKAETRNNTGLVNAFMNVNGPEAISDYPVNPTSKPNKDKVANHREGSLTESGDHLAVLVEYLRIVLHQQQIVLNALCDYFERESLIEFSNNNAEPASPERVARLLLAPFPVNTDIPATARLTAILKDWRNRKLAFSSKYQKDALRAIRDAVFLASLPHKDTLEMVAAISNAIQGEPPSRPSMATAPFWDEDMAEKLGRYAHAVLMGQRTGKNLEQSFLFELLNKNFKDTDTSILFEDRFYEYVFLNEPEGYQKKTTTRKRIDDFAKGCVAQLKEQPKDPISYESYLKADLEQQFMRGQLFFVRVSLPKSDEERVAVDEVTKAFTRLVFIQMETDGNSTVYEIIMVQIAQIDRLLTELFPN
jgi:hypothetical protein